MQRIPYLLMICLMHSCLSVSQVTTGGLAGMVTNTAGDKLVGAFLRLVHEPTGTAQFTRSNSKGMYQFTGLQAGGPYTLHVSFTGHTENHQQDITVLLGEPLQADIRLSTGTADLGNVSVHTGAAWQGISKKMGREQIDRTASAGRNLADLFVQVAQSKRVGNNESAVSFAGQNNRYNAFYIDGSASDDLFGLAASGTVGGQAGISPIAFDAIEHIQVSITPYDASIGNFTGGAIHAVTRSGANQRQSSVYRYSRSTAVGSAGSGDDRATQSGNIYGWRTGGAWLRNRLFYFISGELDRYQFRQPYTIANYTGDHADNRKLSSLTANIISNYGYDPGSYDLRDEQVSSDRLTARVDWRSSRMHTLTATLRYMGGEITFSSRSDASTLYFSHSGYAILNRQLAATFQWKSPPGRDLSHVCLFSITAGEDDRRPLGKPFPRIRIYDGEGSIILGTDISSGVNLLRQQHIAWVEKITFNKDIHHITAGWDISHSSVYNAFIQYAFGSYSFSSVSDLIRNSSPSAYQLGFSTLDERPGDDTKTAARFSVIRSSLFVTDAIRVSQRMVIHAGLRFDRQVYPDQPLSNTSINDSVLPRLAVYHDLQGAKSGSTLRIQNSYSPRIMWQFMSADGNTLIRLGTGVFTGRMPFAWPGGVYQLNGIYTGGVVAGSAQLSRIRLQPDPYRQWTPEQLQVGSNKDPVNLAAAVLHLPQLLRSSFTIERRIGGWRFAMEAMHSHNLSSVSYRNINLLPPVLTTAAPGPRKVYTDSANARIPLGPGYPNPYGYIIWLGNQRGTSGSATDLAITVQTKWETGWSAGAWYRWGRASAVNEGTSSVNLSQWRTMESVNGRNDITVSVSDFSAGHSIRLAAHYRSNSQKKQHSIALSLQYTGQSGWPVSYVYGGESMVRDEGRAGGYELMYIPTTDEIRNISFLPLTYKGMVITPVQQQDQLDQYILSNRYLRSRRGLFAQRNGSRTPFMHTIDLKLVYETRLVLGKRRYRLQLSYDIENLANLLNRQWGKKYEAAFDQLRPVEFMGFDGPAPQQPRFRLNPALLSGGLLTESQRYSPAYASFFSCLAGVRILW